jgi:RNA-directed DNA polymerase
MIYAYPEKLEKFKAMSTVLDVVQFLSIRVNELDQLLINPPYYTFETPKKRGGVRTITAPEDALKKVQQLILKQVEEFYHKPSSVYGFVAMDESEGYACPIVANAANHVNKHYVLTVDLNHFFESIKTMDVFQLFSNEPFYFPEKIALILTRLTTYKGCLPTGAPTSPMLSNLIFRDIDQKLEELAENERCTYSRYADDLTFSSNEPFSEEFLTQIQSCIQPFTLNTKKTRIKKQSQQQKVTGILVNEKVNIDRKWIKQLRAMLHDLKINGVRKASFNHFKKANQESFFIHRLRGNIAFLGQVRGICDKEYNKYQFEFDQLVIKNRVIRPK